jgi:hypothetical protein
MRTRILIKMVRARKDKTKTNEIIEPVVVAPEVATAATATPVPEVASAEVQKPKRKYNKKAKAATPVEEKNEVLSPEVMAAVEEWAAEFVDEPKVLKVDKNHCAYCEVKLEKDDKLCTTDCGCVSHSSCLITEGCDYMIDRRHEHNDFYCKNCDALLYKGPTYWEDRQALTEVAAVSIHTRLQEEDFKKNLKKVREKVKAYNAEYRVFNKFIIEEHGSFMNLAGPLIQQLRNLIVSYTAKIKAHDTYKKANRSSTSKTSSMNRFIAKYNLNWEEKRKLFGGGGRFYRSLYSRPAWIVRRKFRIRLNK